MEKIKIVTDSSCDLDRDYLDELGVHMIPMVISFGNETYKDRTTITTDEFYKKLKTYPDVPTTSQIPPAVFQKEFEKLISEGYSIVFMGISSGLSGSYQSACLAKDMVSSEKIDVIDSLGASVGLGVMIDDAANMVKQGKTREEIVERLTYMRDRMEYVFAVGSLDMLKKGGRISTTQAVMGTLLHVKPILQFTDGKIYPYEKVRGEKGIIKKLVETMEERGEDLKEQVIGINYSQDDKLAHVLKEKISETFGCSKFILSEIGGTIGSHVGGGTTSVFFLGKNVKQAI